MGSQSPSEIKVVLLGTTAAPADMAIPGVSRDLIQNREWERKEVVSFFLGESVLFTNIPIPDPGKEIALTVSTQFLGSPYLPFRKVFKAEDKISSYEVPLSGSCFQSPGTFVWDISEETPTEEGCRRILAVGAFKAKMAPSFGM